MTKVFVYLCKCGSLHVYYQRGKTLPKIEVCDTCEELPHLVKPGEMGKIDVHTITEMICPACGERQKLRNNTKSSEAVCKFCGYKNSENSK
jgi:acetone carboxylase gamma subunit